MKNLICILLVGGLFGCAPIRKTVQAEPIVFQCTAFNYTQYKNASGQVLTFDNTECIAKISACGMEFKWGIYVTDVKADPAPLHYAYSSHTHPLDGCPVTSQGNYMCSIRLDAASNYNTPSKIYVQCKNDTYTSPVTEYNAF